MEEYSPAYWPPEKREGCGDFLDNVESVNAEDPKDQIKQAFMVMGVFLLINSIIILIMIFKGAES